MKIKTFLIIILTLTLVSCASMAAPAPTEAQKPIEKIGIIFRDWLPSVTIIVVGIWELFKYTINREKEMPAIEGELRMSSIPIGEFRLIELDALWKNRSPRPVKLNTQKCRIDVSSLSNLEPGSLHTDTLSALEYSDKPFESSDSMLLEPNTDTDSHLKAFFVIPPGKLYLVRWTLYQDKINGYEWSKESVIDLR